VHHECKEKINETCDFGPLKKAIITPNEIRYMGSTTLTSKTKTFIQNLQKNKKPVV
jgi:hypothetical protein